MKWLKWSVNIFVTQTHMHLLHTHSYINAYKQKNLWVYARVGNEEGFAVFNAFSVVILSINFTFTFCCAAGQTNNHWMRLLITIKSGR